MNVIVNGENREIAPGSTVADVVRSLTEATRGVAVAVNDEVVPRTGWSGRHVTDHDRVDVLTAVQGG
ncbi:sulfur carrier protein ThiS [Murinocardiopsis flavida]|uniref:sulfur carrier protein ThiS n=1 Tax=Murinocardiopsis flavida TaxID=645275 RepID=UPI000D0D57E2|nr:sulfur carrier protein ThiS [Murinocardiopsis flavida]